jgi:formylglycine-generating enzyme required for sulfatase activity
MNALRFTRFAAALVFALSVTAAHAQSIDWVTVGDPGNVADTTGYGAVAASFRIMKYEFTNQQYVAFLNAVDPNGTNPNEIYNTNMGSDAHGGISNTGTTAGSKYASKTNMADKPVNYVSWFDAARVSNWLQAGGTTYGTSLSGSTAINSGAYTLNGATSGTAPAVNPGATFYIPTENQWYKAAYYKGGSTNAGYWDYATQDDTAPTAVTAGLTGIGSAGSTGNFANYSQGASWNGQTGNVTTVGTNGRPSAYGAFDMGGNVYEWNDLTGVADSSRNRRGGNWNNNVATLLASTRENYSPSQQNFGTGFRLAGPAGVPEIDPAGIGSVLALVTGALGLLERRRSRR